MKTSRSNNSKQSSQGTSKKPRPEIRDNMDSRSGNNKQKEGRATKKKK